MLRKSTFREIRTSLARYLAILSIVALGVGFFSGLKDCKASMESTARRYLDRTNFYDYQILSSYGADDDSVALASSWDGVSAAEGSVQVDVMAKSGDGDSRALKAISLPSEINKLNLVEGRLPQNANECAVDAYSITDEGFHVGDRIVLSDENDKDKLKQFSVHDFEIVGTVNTPIYLDYQRGSTDIGNGSLDTFFFIDRDAFDVDYYTNLYVKLSGDEASITPEHEDKLKANEDNMKALSEAVTDGRRETARKEAQDELDEKKQEYEDNLAKYEKEKKNAEKKLDKAEDQIEKGEKTIKNTRSELNAAIQQANNAIATLPATISDLNSKKAQAEAGIAQINAAAEEEKAKLKAAFDAGAIDEQTYAAGIAGIDEGTKTEIAKVEASIAEIDKGIAQAEAGLAQAKAGLAQAQAGLEELDRQEKKLDSSEKQLKKEEKKADSEFDKAKKELDDAKDKLDEAQEKIDDMEQGNSYALSRTENAGYSSFDSNSSIVSNIAKIFPVFFFLIAALVCMTTMTRMVDEQRTQIGILKALGYSNAQVVGKYMFYSGSAALIGALLGFFVGCKVFPVAIWNAYTMMYDFSNEVDYIIDWKLGLLSIGASLLCSMGATWVSIASDFRVAPSDLIRPKTPPAGKRILLERIRPLWNRISFLYKVSIRNIFRDKKRFLMMVIGVSGCTALLVAGIGIRATISKVADYQFDEISTYDITTIFSKNMTADRQADFLDDLSEAGELPDDAVRFLHRGEVTIDMGSGKTVDVSCVATEAEGFGEFVDLHSGDQHIDYPGPGEAVIVKKTNHDYGIGVGDKIKLREDYREMEVTITGVADNYVYDSIYISPETYREGFGKEPDLKAAYINLDEGSSEEEIRSFAAKAAGYENAAAVQTNIDVRENVAKMMKSLDAIVYVVILSAALLACIVLYNLTNINITERIREIATIKVLGFNQLEVSQYVFRENLFLTAVAALVGIPMGKWLLRFVIDNIVLSMIYFEPRHGPYDIPIAVALTFVFAMFVNLAMQRRLRNVSMTESLKSVE